MGQGKQSIRIADFGRVVTGKTPPTKQPDLYGSCYPFITPTDINDDSRYTEPARFISEKGREKHASSMLPPNTVCFTCIASIGKICMTSQLSLTNQQINSVVVDHTRYNPRYVFYLLRTETERIKAVASGVATPIINKTSFSELAIEVHPLPTQRKIAAILSAYDDLIENNLRRIKILEEMAQNLYHEWFVKFRFPGHQHVRFVDSSLGRIPEGWEVGTLGAVSYVIPGYAFKSKDWADTGIPVIKIKNIRPGNLIDTDQVDHVPEAILSSTHTKFWLNSGDILIAMTGATAGKVGKLRSKKSMLLNQRVAKIEPKQNFKELVWCAVSSPDAEDRFYALADGAAQPNMSGSQIENSELIIPKTDLVQQFNDYVSPFINDVDNMILRNQNLRRTRDLLLPKLISGEVDVSELDINIPEEAV